MTRRAFTLIELLVVIAIIAILAAILFPVFASAKAAAKAAANLSNLKQIATGHLLYLNDYDDSFALMTRFESEASQSAMFGETAPMETRYRGEIRWTETIEPYTKNREILVSPQESVTGGTNLERRWTQVQFYGVVGRGAGYQFQFHGIDNPFAIGSPLIEPAYIDGPFGIAGSADAAYTMLQNAQVPSLTQTSIERVSEVVMIADAGAYDMGFGRTSHFIDDAHGPCVTTSRYGIGPSAHAQWSENFYIGPWARRGASGAYQGGRKCEFEESQQGKTAYAAIDGSAKLVDLRGQMYARGKGKVQWLTGVDVLRRLFVGPLD